RRGAPRPAGAEYDRYTRRGAQAGGGDGIETRRREKKAYALFHVFFSHLLVYPLRGRGSHSPSARATYTAAVKSPHTLIVVRHMSRIRSTPRMIAIPSAGTPTVASTTMRSGSEPPGTPAAPTAVITLRVSTT